MDAYTGEIRPFAGGYEPDGWAYCDGRTLNITQYEPLYSLIGTVYGGDGVRTFAVPNLGGRVPIGAGQRPAAAAYAFSSSGGAPAVTLSVAQLPVHTHTLRGTTRAATDSVPDTTHFLAATIPEVRPYNDMTQTGSGDAQFSPAAIGNSGGGAAHNNIMPSQVVAYIICLSGLYPDLE